MFLKIFSFIHSIKDRVTYIILYNNKLNYLFLLGKYPK